MLCITGLLRCGKSCRLRWINYLRPDLKRGNFTEEEDELIINLHSLLGNKYEDNHILLQFSSHYSFVLHLQVSHVSFSENKKVIKFTLL